MVFWYVTIDHSAFSTLRENPQVDNKPPRLFGSVPGGGSPLNHWLSREGTTKMQKGQFMDPLYEAFPSSNRSKLIVWDRTYLPILLIWAIISPPPLTLDISVPDDKGVKLLIVYVGFICYVIPEQRKTCYALRFALKVLFTTCCNVCLIIFRFFQEKISCSISFSKISEQKKADPSFFPKAFASIKR